MNALVPQLVPILARWETCQLKAYKDNDGSWHIGYGHGNANNFAPFVDEHTELRDEAEAMSILMGELNEVYLPQAANLFRKIDLKVNDFYYSGIVDVIYNRGIGRFAGVDVGSKAFPKGSKAWDILKNEQGAKHFKERAAQALIISNVDGFVPLDVAKDKITGVERVHLGLTLRRAADCTLCTWIR